MKNSRKRLNWPESTAISVLLASLTTITLTLILRGNSDEHKTASKDDIQ